MALAIAESHWQWGDGESPVARSGAAKLGLWRHTSDFEDVLRDRDGGLAPVTGGDPRIHAGNHGAYGSFEQRPWSELQDAGQGLTAWLRVGGAPADRSECSWVTDWGAVRTWPSPGRDADVLGLGVLAAQVSADDARAARLENGDDAPLPDFGRVAELGYRWQATSRWTMTPGIQWVLHPGASSEVADAAVLGLRVSSE